MLDVRWFPYEGLVRVTDAVIHDVDAEILTTGRVLLPQFVENVRRIKSGILRNQARYHLYVACDEDWMFEPVESGRRFLVQLPPKLSQKR